MRRLEERRAGSYSNFILHVILLQPCCVRIPHAYTIETMLHLAAPVLISANVLHDDTSLMQAAQDTEGRQVQSYQQLVAIRNPDVEYQRVGGQCPSGLCNTCTKEPCVFKAKPASKTVRALAMKKLNEALN